MIPQNGIELVSSNLDSEGPLASSYLNAIDGIGQEDLFFGYNKDDKATPSEETNYLKEYLDRVITEGKTVLTTDYCSTPSNVTLSILSNTERNYIPNS
jgi:cysteinyl-tRNA synthetase